MSQVVQPRDLEILRTLARVQFLSSPEITSAFFPSPKRGWQRLSYLTAANLIKKHRAGIPNRAYSLYQLTGRGLRKMLDEFPDEPVVDGLDERLSTQDPADNLEHRQALVSLYLDLIRGDDRADESSKEALRLWMAEVRHRAGQIAWRADGTVTLQSSSLSGNRQIVPDATVEHMGKRLRLFIELDRSNKVLSRVKENLERYALFLRGGYAQTYLDGFAPSVVYVVRSEARRANIERLGAPLLGSLCSWQVLVADRDAVPALAATLFDEERIPRGHVSTPHQLPVKALRASTTAFLRSTSTLLKEHRELFASIEAQSPELHARWLADLQSVYQLLKEPRHAG